MLSSTYYERLDRMSIKILIIVLLFLIQIQLYLNIYLKLSFCVSCNPKRGLYNKFNINLTKSVAVYHKILFLIVCFCQIYFLFLCSCLTIEMIHNIIWCKTVSHISFFITCSITCKNQNVLSISVFTQV